MKKYSVIIPHYGQAQTLAKCIGSVKDQDYKSVEIIVSMDGKNKQAESILKTYLDLRVVYTDKEKSGAPAARNKGAEIATGDYYLFLDSDSYLQPGALTHWAEIFEENPDCGFVYSGYRIVGSEQPYDSQEFDPYHLEANNYIDTSNPLRKEVYQPWDESLQSLQDWAFWLKIVKAGVKGHYLRKSLYLEKEPPKKGSISEDSSQNWIERRKVVQQKLGLRVSQIAVTSFAAVHHAKRTAKLLGFDYVDPIHLYVKPHEYKLFYMLGLFIQNSENNFLPFSEMKTGMMKKGIIRAIHWIGTDILHMMTKASFADLRAISKPYNEKLVQYCQTKDNLEELESMGLKAELNPLPVEVNLDVEPLPYPKEFTVAVYDHGLSQEDMYNQGLMDEIVKSMPDVKFVYFGAENMVGKDKNVTFLGRVGKVEDVIKKSSCLLRITRHDGLPVTPVEFLNHHRPVISNVDLPYCFKIDFDTRLTDRNISVVKKQILKAVRDYKKQMPKPGFFKNAKKHYANMLDPKHLRSALEKLIK